MDAAGLEHGGPSAHNNIENTTDLPPPFPGNDEAHEASGLAPDVSGEESSPSTSARAVPVTVSENVDAEEPPPPFAPYKAKWYASTHPGEALYRFLLTQVATPPLHNTVRLRGTHKEQHSRVVSYTTPQGYLQTRTENHTVTITDFAFALDLTHALVPGGHTHWSVPDSTPAYRGLMVRQITEPTRASSGDPGVDVEADEGGGGEVDRTGRNLITRKATNKEIMKYEGEKYPRSERGALPWEAPNSTGSCMPHEVLSKTVREWADAYARRPKRLKEFVYKKTVYGWSTPALSDALYQIISSTPSPATAFYIDIDLPRTRIIIQPNTRLARFMSLGNRSYLGMALLWFTLIYPVLWLFRQFAREGGGRWEVCGGVYAFNIVEDALPEESLREIAFPEPTIGGVLSESALLLEVQRALAFTAARPRVEAMVGYNLSYPPQSYPLVSHAPYAIQPQPPHSRLVTTPTGGMVRITGFSEDEWVRAWEPTIQRCIGKRVKQDHPIVQPI